MKFKSKRLISSVLAFAVTISSMVFAPVSTNADTAKIDVWDFGGVAESDTALYNNHIDTSFLDNLEIVGDAASGNKGKFTTAGDYDFNGLNVNSNKNDRLFYNGADGLRSYGTNGKATTAYSDGYTANGMWYANGTGGDSRRYLSLQLNQGDGVKLYYGASNSADTPVYFTSASSETQTDTAVGGECKSADFIATSTDTYKIWFDAGGGKPIVNRVVRTPAVQVTGNIDLNGNDVSGYTVSFKNDTTDGVTEAVLSGNAYSVSLTPGYSYTATLSGAVGYGFTNATKKVEVTSSDLSAGVSHDLVVEPKSVYKVTGGISGFAADYDTSKLGVELVPPEDSMTDTVTAAVDLSAMTYSATLEPDVEYTISLTGVNDYEVTGTAVISNTVDCTVDINVAAKAVYSVSGGFKGAVATGLTFTNLEDNYVYTASVADGKYSVELRDGEYAASVTDAGLSTTTHVVVNGKAVVKDIYVPKNITPEPTYTNDVYVGCEGKSPNFDTMTEALALVNDTNALIADGEIRVHIAPGTYREQISVTRPNVTFVKEGSGEVKLTWYYGIGYSYYSADATGYYNDENAYDKYAKNQVQKWGTAVYLKSGASNFKAEGITFENSFNKYVTDEEIADGVTVAASGLPERTYATDVLSKAATERATAICVESDNTEFKDCTFIGSQDTLYIGGSSTNHVYFKNCAIEGNTDYIFGSGNAVFDGCELRFAGYSDNATGGYITAGRSNNYEGYKGYLFRSCAITNASGTISASGYFGRPWDANADITFLNCTVPAADTITAEGWTSMSGVNPEQANFKEYGTTLTDGTAVDTSARVSGTVLTDASSIIPTDYFGGWTPTYYTDDVLPVEFTVAPYLSTGGDVLLPQTGDTFTVKYSLGDNDPNDISVITYTLIAEDGTETVVKTETATAKTGLVLTKDMIGSKLKITVSPKTINGNSAADVSVITEKEITLGSGHIDTDRPSGKAVVFMAGDSTVKDYSAGAINNSGANRPEGSWGEFLEYFVDDSYEVMNYAEGGRSSRTFYNGTKDDDHFYDKIKDQIMAGDYLFIQFGHNDSSADYVDRYVPLGTPDASGKYPYTAQTGTADNESGTFCWYLQQYVDLAKNAGATPVLVTPVSRMYFNADGTIRPHHGNNDEYVQATKQVAEDNGIECIDLYNMSKSLYEDCYKIDGANGSSDVAYRLFSQGEKTHHSKLGGYILGTEMAIQIRDNSSIGTLSSHITVDMPLYITNDKDVEEFMVNTSGVFSGTGRNDSGVIDASVAAPEYLVTLENELLNNLMNSEPPTTESTTEASTETSTESTTESSTESTTETPDPTPTPSGVYGDADNNGVVNAADVAMIVEYVLSGAPYVNDVEYVDVSSDGIVDTKDATMILQHVLNQAYSIDKNKN